MLEFEAILLIKWCGEDLTMLMLDLLTEMKMICCLSYFTGLSEWLNQIRLNCVWNLSGTIQVFLYLLTSHWWFICWVCSISSSLSCLASGVGRPSLRSFVSATALNVDLNHGYWCCGCFIFYCSADPWVCCLLKRPYK